MRGAVVCCAWPVSKVNVAARTCFVNVARRSKVVVHTRDSAVASLTEVGILSDNVRSWVN